MGLCVPIAKCFSDIFFWVGQTLLSKWSPGILWPFSDRNTAEKEALETLQGNDSSRIDLLPSEAIWIPCIDHCCSNGLGWDGSQKPWRRYGWRNLQRSLRKLIHPLNKWWNPNSNASSLTSGPIVNVTIQLGQQWSLPSTLSEHTSQSHKNKIISE